MGVIHGSSLRSGDEEADELIARQDEAEGHDDHIGGVGVAPEAGRLPPESDDDQDGAQRQKLADLDPDVEGQEIADQAVGREVEVLELGRQAEAVEQAEDEGRGLGRGLEPEKPLIGPMLSRAL